MPSKELLKELAKLGVVVGVNVKKGQPLLINCPPQASDLAYECAKVAYEAGASEVWVDFADERLGRLTYENVDTDILCDIPSFKLDRIRHRINKGYCTLHIISDDPDLLDGIDGDKINKVRIANMKATKEFQYYSMNNVGQWSILAYPNLTWAKKMFKDVSDEEAMDKLWDAILKTSRVEIGKTLENWEKHNQEIKVHSKRLNEYNFKSLHFKNSLGTDLEVGLVENHIWEGGADVASNGQVFNPNIPTEEVFTMPDNRYINGTVVSTKPLSYDGKLIEDFKLTFKDGKVVEYSARQNEETLKNLLETDEGSKSLGEVALISHDSPISNMNLLFYNTLFDENASCHLALGACYPSNVKGGTSMSEEELAKIGGNSSLNHVDFMFGSEDMSVIGTTHDGQKVEVFKDGNFVF